MQEIEYKKQHSPKSVSNAEQWEGVSSISPLMQESAQGNYSAL